MKRANWRATTLMEKARQFVARMKDVTEFLASLDLNPAMGPVNATATYQDSCHLAHGQRIRIPPRQLLARIPGLNFQEMPLSDVCCGSAGIYNVVQNEMSMQILEKKMSNVNLTSATLIVTANPGCMLQLEAGVKRHGRNQRVAHVVEVLDEAYRNYGH
jgi:glycolate oxidase iron-sulfur subunit